MAGSREHRKQIPSDKQYKLTRVMSGNIPLTSSTQPNMMQDYVGRLKDEAYIRERNKMLDKSKEEKRIWDARAEAAISTSYFNALREKNYEQAFELSKQYPPLNKHWRTFVPDEAKAQLFAAAGNQIFQGSQQTSMQASLHSSIAPALQTREARKAYMQQVQDTGVKSVTGLLNEHDVLYLTLYGCVMTEVLALLLDAAKVQITVAQFEAIMDAALNRNTVMSTMDMATGKAIPYSRNHLQQTYKISSTGVPDKGGTLDVGVYRDKLVDFYKFKLGTMGYDVSDVEYISGDNISEHSAKYDIYASVRSAKAADGSGRGHDFGVYIPKGAKFRSLPEYRAEHPSRFRDPLDWRDINLQNASIRGYFIKR